MKEKYTSFLSSVDNSNSFSSSFFSVSEDSTVFNSFWSVEVLSDWSTLTTAISFSWILSFSDKFSSCGFSF